MSTITDPVSGQPSGVRGPATLESVGELAGVSKSTVSRVINGSPGVSAKTVLADRD